MLKDRLALIETEIAKTKARAAKLYLASITYPKSEELVVRYEQARTHLTNLMCDAQIVRELISEGIQ